MRHPDLCTQKQTDHINTEINVAALRRFFIQKNHKEAIPDVVTPNVDIDIEEGEVNLEEAADDDE